MKRNIIFIAFLFLAFSLHAQLPTGFNPIIADYDEVIPDHGPDGVTTDWYHSKGSSPDSIKIVANPLKDADNPSDNVILWQRPPGEWKLMDYWYNVDSDGLYFDESFTSFEFKIRSDSLTKVYVKIKGNVDGSNETIAENFYGYIPNDKGNWQHYVLDFDQQAIQGLGDEITITKIQIFPNPQGSYSGEDSVYIDDVKFNVALSDVALDVTSKTISVGDTFRLTPIFAPDYATNKSVTWLSSDTTVATVDSTGLVTGVAEGEAIIRVKTDEGSYTADCNVTVGTGTNVAEINSNIFKVYPNPSTDGFIFVELKQSYNSPFQVNVYDLTGNNLINVTQNTGKRIQLNHNLKPGMYFMKINIDDKTNTIKYLVK